MSIINEFIKSTGADLEYITKYVKQHGVDKLYCKCGKFKKLKKNANIATYCGKKECWMHTGKSRPEHSIKMKNCKSKKYLDNLIKPGELKNPEVNSNKFKTKILENKGIEINNLVEDFRKYNSDKYKLDAPKRYISWYNKLPNKLKTIITQTYGILELNLDIIENMDVQQRDDLFHTIHGLNTIKNNENLIKTGGFFKTHLVDNLEYNTKVSSVICRSKYEKKFIELFENNKIPWEYESITIKCKRGIYTPDFLITYNNQKILIEVKGTLYGYPKDYIENKIKSAIEFCDKNNMVFSFILNKQVSMNEILKNRIKNIEEIYVKN